MYALAAFDMDGTLLTPDHLLQPETLDTLQRIREKGVQCVFATGRHAVEMQWILSTVKQDGYLISCNGTYIHDRQGNLLYSATLPMQIVEEVIHKDWKTNAKMHLFREKDWLTNQEDPEVLVSHQFSGFKYEIVSFSSLPMDGISKICFHGEYNDLLELEIQLKALLENRADLCFSSSTFLEVLPLGCNKGSALSALCEMLAIPLSRCMAFGDAMNDKEMLELVGKGCVMGNALERLKQALPHLEVIGTCSEQGVSRFLQHWLETSADSVR